MTRSRTSTLRCPGFISVWLYGPIMTMMAIWTCCFPVHQAFRVLFPELSYSGTMAGINSLLFRALCPTSGIALLHGVTSTMMAIWTCFSAELMPQVVTVLDYSGTLVMEFSPMIYRLWIIVTLCRQWNSLTLIMMAIWTL